MRNEKDTGGWAGSHAAQRSTGNLIKMSMNIYIISYLHGCK